MALIRRVSHGMFNEIYRELLRSLDPNRPEAEWRRIFSYPWPREEDYCGYALVENRKPVAYLGLIFSEVRVRDELARFCNVTSWIAHEAYRAEAIRLVLLLRELKGHTITNLSCNATAFTVFSKLGFNVLETHKRILFPVPMITRSRSVDAHVVLDHASIETRLTGRDVDLFRDHQPYAEHLVVEDQDGYCYVMYSIGRRWGVRTARVHYVSHLQRFTQQIGRIQRTLRNRSGIALAECDERLLRGTHVPWSVGKRLMTPRLYKSRALTPDQVNNLYSEIVLLNLS